jgi:hypothetical protein
MAGGDGGAGRAVLAEELQQRVETEIALYSKIAEVNAIKAE